MLKGRSLADVAQLKHLLSSSADNYLEIGCYDGVNLRGLADGFDNKNIYGIDPFISDGHVGSPIGAVLNVQKENLYSNIRSSKNIFFYEMTSEEFLHKHKNYEEMNISFIFIDGAHIYDVIKIDIELALACLSGNKSKSGLILFHDLHIPDVLKAIDHLKAVCADQNVSCVSLPTAGLFEIKYA